MSTFCYATNAVHKRAILKWIAAQRRTTVQWYEDKPGAGRTPGLDQMLADLAKIKSPTTVVVYSLDTFGSSLKVVLTALHDVLLNDHRVVGINPKVDIAGPAAFDLLVAVSMLGRETRREQRRVGIEAAKARGDVYKGRKKGTIKPGIDLQHVKDLRAQGLTHEQMAKELGVHRLTVINYLRRAGA